MTVSYALTGLSAARELAHLPSAEQQNSNQVRVLLSPFILGSDGSAETQTAVDGFVEALGQTLCMLQPVVLQKNSDVHRLTKDFRMRAYEKPGCRNRQPGIFVPDPVHV